MAETLTLTTRRIGWAFLLGLVVSATASAQIDDRISREGLERRAARRVFAVDIRPDSPIEVYQVEEVRQQLPPHLYAVRIRNRSADVIPSLTVAAVVVASDGTTKAIRLLDAVKNLKPNQARRQETPIRGAVLNVTDRVAFVVAAVTTADGQTWKPSDDEMRARVKEAAQMAPLR